MSLHMLPTVTPKMVLLVRRRRMPRNQHQLPSPRGIVDSSKRCQEIFSSRRQPMGSDYQLHQRCVPTRQPTHQRRVYRKCTIKTMGKGYQRQILSVLLQLQTPLLPRNSATNTSGQKSKTSYFKRVLVENPASMDKNERWANIAN